MLSEPPERSITSGAKRAKILIAGSGYVGSVLAERLASDGHDVWALRRSNAAPPAGVHAFQADLSDPSSLAALPPDLNYVFYTAAPDASSPAGYSAAYVEGLRNLLERLTRQPRQPKRVLFTSSTGVYAQSGGEWVDEGSTTEPATFSGKLLLAGEQVLRESSLPSTVLRLGGIYGPGRARLVDEVVAGTARCPDGPDRWSNRIHRDDCAGALRHVMSLPAPEPVYIGVDNEPAPICEILRWIAIRTNSPMPAAGDPPGSSVSRERGPRSNKRCSNERLAATGYRFLFPTYREGFEALIRSRPRVDQY